MNNKRTAEESVGVRSTASNVSPRTKRAIDFKRLDCFIRSRELRVSRRDVLGCSNLSVSLGLLHHQQYHLHHSCSLQGVE